MLATLTKRHKHDAVNMIKVNMMR